MAEIPWPKRKPGRQPSGKKDVVWKWSEARVAMMLRSRAAGESWDDILIGVNRLAGPPIESAHACRIKFCLLPKEMTQPIIAQEKAGQPASAPAPVEVPKLTPGKWTEERINLLLKLRAEDYHDDDIIDALNKLAGPKLGPLAIRDRISYERARAHLPGMRLANLALSYKGLRRAYMFPETEKTAPLAQPSLKAPIITASNPPAAPPLKQSRKINPEVSDVFIARDAAAAMDAPIDWPAALNWARHNKVDIEALGEIDAIKKINQVRYILGLTPWRVIPTRGFPEPLPPPEFGAGSRDNYSKPKRGDAHA